MWGAALGPFVLGGKDGLELTGLALGLVLTGDALGCLVGDNVGESVDGASVGTVGALEEGTEEGEWVEVGAVLTGDALGARDTGPAVG